MNDPFRITEPTCISFSGGRTSAYMLWRVLQSNNGLPDEAVVCFANTGKEEEATLRFVDRCSREWGVPITWLEYRTDEPFAVVDFETASRNGEPFEALIRKKNYLPNPVTRFCTAELKVLTIDRYLKSIGWVEYATMVGIRADEYRRAAKLRDSKLTPLINAGVTQKDVQAFWANKDFDLSLEFRNGITAAGNCDLCYLKGAHQIRSLIAQQPKRVEFWMRMEQAIGATFRSDRPSYSQMAQFIANQQDMFDPAEESIACFCGD